MLFPSEYFIPRIFLPAFTLFLVYSTLYQMRETFFGRNSQKDRPTRLATNAFPIWIPWVCIPNFTLFLVYSTLYQIKRGLYKKKVADRDSAIRKEIFRKKSLERTTILPHWPALVSPLNAFHNDCFLSRPFK
mgnify:CR=1 FL=1